MMSRRPRSIAKPATGRWRWFDDLGEAYRDGTGVAKDVSKATTLYQKGCSLARSACDDLKRLLASTPPIRRQPLRQSSISAATQRLTQQCPPPAQSEGTSLSPATNKRISPRC